MQKVSYDIQAQHKQYGLRHRIKLAIHAAMGDTLIKVVMENSNENGMFKLWDKSQGIVGCRITRIGRNNIFVEDKYSTINALTSLIILKNQWTDYMELVLQLVPVNSESERESVVFNQEHSFPFRIYDISLSECQTGLVCFLISCRDTTFYYIRMTNCISRRINEHNSDFGFQSTIPPQLRPFSVFAYMCDFDKNRELLFRVEKQWNIKRNYLMNQGICCQKQWAIFCASVIDDVHNYRKKNNDSRLIFLFRDRY